jgi:hypothetical protein
MDSTAPPQETGPGSSGPSVNQPLLPPPLSPTTDMGPGVGSSENSSRALELEPRSDNASLFPSTYV